jgi:hypothetical protein
MPHGKIKTTIFANIRHIILLLFIGTSMKRDNKLEVAENRCCGFRLDLRQGESSPGFKFYYYKNLAYDKITTVI